VRAVVSFTVTVEARVAAAGAQPAPSLNERSVVVGKHVLRKPAALLEVDRMSERNAYHLGAAENGGPGNGEGGLRAPPELGRLGKAWWWLHFAILVKLARLRFIAILIAIGLVIARWDTLTAYYEKLTRPILSQETTAGTDIEYWCPMHPNIVRDHPDKCPLCNMALAKRKKGERSEGEALPPGVVSRVQLTPFKVVVAGIETAEIGYQHLARDVTAIGFVEFDERKLARISVRATGKSLLEKLFVNVTGQMVTKGEPLAEVYSRDLAVSVQNLLDARQSGNAGREGMARERLRLFGIDQEQIDRIVETGKPISRLFIRAPISGHVIKKYQVEGEYVEEGTRLYDVADLSTVWIDAQVYEDELALLHEGLAVSATTKAFPNRAFQGKLAFVHPHLDASTRTLRVRFDMDNPRHDLRPGMWATVRLQVPATQMDLLASDADKGQKEAYRQGQVLAVPERAVIDTGSRKLVYREAEPDVFEGIEVELGPRCGDFYPVIRGLRARDRVATAGSFLIDAETRLTAGASSTYFGASGGPHSDQHAATTAARPSMSRDEDDKAAAVLSKLPAQDRALAQKQVYCPVQGTRLGTMGVPVKVILEGQPVFLCCKNCLSRAQSNPRATLDRMAQRQQPGKPEAPAPALPSAEEREIQANLAKLGPEDRRLAQEQGFCPIQTETRLGEMDVPVAVEVKGHKVFLCCGGCKKQALAHPEQTLAKVEKLKARSRGAR
jgi:multidrug efflux pump subunit AcrA (membrane-fusion protein)